ncbi:hypothetical protein GAY30_01175 [Azospirillum brasilense]|nr:hypothetical protein [Azospirillum brasilense]NUB32854.1 hypothetical protein [Azospirillum brasilense]RIW06306.1 hypothetical protein D2T81_06430 [Azospirillum brasilense]
MKSQLFAFPNLFVWANMAPMRRRGNGAARENAFVSGHEFRRVPHPSDPIGAGRRGVIRRRRPNGRCRKAPDAGCRLGGAVHRSARGRRPSW